MAGKGAPKGNKYGKGKKGRSGRKSFYEEKARAEMLIDAWFGKGINVKAVTNHINKALKGELNLQFFKLWLAKGIKSERILNEMAKKMFPDKQDVQGNLTVNTFANWADEISKKIDNDGTGNPEVHRSEE